MISAYLEALLKSNNKNDKFKVTILNVVGSQFIFDNCVYFLLKLLRDAKTENLDLLGVTSVGVKVGKIILDKYLRINKGDDISNFKT